jgi:hypothetical protein
MVAARRQRGGEYNLYSAVGGLVWVREMAGRGLYQNIFLVSSYEKTAVFQVI